MFIQGSKRSLLKNDNEISIFMTDNNGSKVDLFISLKMIFSPFCFLQLHRAEKDGMLLEAHFNFRSRAYL